MKHRLGLLAFAGVALAAPRAFAEPPPAVDVAIHDVPPPRRYVAVEFNPVPLIIGKISANVVIAPIDHHALVLSPFYVSTTTAPIYVFDDSGSPSQLPQQTFRGFGGEIGYRYYFGQRGPRGFFIGPSFILASFTATAANGTETDFLNIGGAADVGFQALIGDRVSLTLGAGLQYTATTRSIPDQQFPADVYANDRVWPRLLASIGFAF